MHIASMHWHGGQIVVNPWTYNVGFTQRIDSYAHVEHAGMMGIWLHGLKRLRRSRMGAMGPI